MKIAVLGTGMVGTAIATKLAQVGHQVMMGARDGSNPNAVQWAFDNGENASNGSFADAAGFGEIVFNCIHGQAAVEGLISAGGDRLAGKILIDQSNPLDFSRGMPPALFTPPFDSLGEQIQRAFPKSKVVKALNTINAEVMVSPRMIAGNHATFVAGEDAEAKGTVAAYLKEWFDWPEVIDVGGITAARGLEAYVLFWLGVMVSHDSPFFNIEVHRKL